MIKVGAINIDVSHPFDFCNVLKQEERARYVAVYNDGFRGEDEVEAFAKANDLTICKSLDELADIVDIGFVHSCNWDKHLDYAKPFIKKGKPVFIDKPVVGNMKQIEELRCLFDNGAKIIGTSALRYCEEVVRVQEKMKENNVSPMHTVVTVGLDEFNYAVHAAEMICGIHSAKPVSCQHMFTSANGGVKCDTYLVKFEDGSTAQYICVDKRFAKFNTIVLAGSKKFSHDFCFTVDAANLYRTLLARVCDYMEGKGNTLETCDEMCDAIKIMLAGKASLENGDIEIPLDSKMLWDTSFDGYKFEEEYAANAKKR